MKGIFRIFKNKKPEIVEVVAEPKPDFSRQMTIIETSEEENDDNN